MGRDLTRELDLETVLQRAIDAAHELSAARYAALAVLDESRSGLERLLYRGVDEQAGAEMTAVAREQEAIRALFDSREPTRLDDVGELLTVAELPSGGKIAGAFLGVPISVDGEPAGYLALLTDSDGGPFSDADQQTVETVAEWAAIAIANARRHATLELHSEKLERAVHGLGETTEVARSVGGETDLERVLETIVRRARALVEARAVVILLEDAGTLAVASTAGELSRDFHHQTIAMEGTVLGAIVENGKAERIDAGSSAISSSAGELRTEAEAGLIVPMCFHGSALGAIAAFDRLERGPQFTAEDERLMLSFASSAATAVATAQSVTSERLRQSIEASEYERGRWARELHDDTLQGLGALRVMLAAALQRSPDELEGAIVDAIAQIEEEITKLRSLITELRPAALDEVGLAAAIEILASHISSSQGIEIDIVVELRCDEVDRPDPELENTVYRVIQEGLNNVAKHARAEHVRLHVTESDGQIEIEIADDGGGFEPGPTQGGFGLLGMRERLAMFSGRLEIASAPGRGTTLWASLPHPAG